MIYNIRRSTFFFFNDTATTEIYTLSLHDALPISGANRRSDRSRLGSCRQRIRGYTRELNFSDCSTLDRSEEHTSELQSQSNLVCRLLLEKKKKNSTKQSFIKWHSVNTVATISTPY